VIFDEQDEPYLKEIARVALNQSKTAKILSHIGVCLFANKNIVHLQPINKYTKPFVR
jgi:hypothetical protein